mgnify:CR=1 FL=1
MLCRQRLSLKGVAVVDNNHRLLCNNFRLPAMGLAQNFMLGSEFSVCEGRNVFRNAESDTRTDVIHPFRLDRRDCRRVIVRLDQILFKLIKLGLRNLRELWVALFEQILCCRSRDKEHLSGMLKPHQMVHGGV